MENNSLPEFRFYYFTSLYHETVLFYKNVLELKEMRSWDRGTNNRGTIFYSPNGTGLIEIEEGDKTPVIQGALYIEVQDVDEWYRQLSKHPVKIIQPLMDTSYGHRSFKIEDPNKLEIGLFKYIN
jgi:predicted enzyme related to lactoylglutathione lyase